MYTMRNFFGWAIFAALILAVALSPSGAWATNHPWNGDGASITIENDDTVTIAAGASGILTVPAGADITIEGSVTGGGGITIDIGDGATVTWTADYSGTVGGGGRLITLQRSGSFIVADGSITVTPYSDTAIGNSYGNNVSVTVNGGAVKSPGSAIILYSGDVTVNGGSITTESSSGSAINVSTGSVTVNGGAVTATGGNIYTIHVGTGDVTVNGGVITAVRGAINVNNGSVTVDGDALIYMGAGYPINPPTTPTKGIVFVGAAGTAYGDVTLPRDLTIKSGETLTIPDGASLTVPSGTTLRVETGGAIVNSGTITVKTGGTLDGNEGITGNPIVYTIDIKAIPGVTAPVTGETPVTAITETGQYTGTVAWSPQVTNKFAAGTVYTATITLIPKPDRTLAGVAANSFTVAGAASVSNEENTGVIMAVFPATSGGGTPPPGPTPSPDPDPTPPPSNSTTPTEISVTLSGSKLAAEKQTDGTYLIVAPTGTDITALAITFALPSGATISPANGSAQNFSGGPVTYTITAANGTTKERIVVAVRVESPSPTDKPYFSDVSSVCEVAYVANEDGTISVCLRIPFLAGSDPALIEAMKATITGVTGSGATPSNVSYSYVDASGKVIPIDARSTKSASVPAPYLQISFTTPSLDAVKKGALEKVEYWLKNDATEYVQTYSTPLEFSEIALTDETPKTPVLPDDPDDPDDADDPDAPDNPDDPDDAGYPDKPAGGGGCSTGAAGFFGLAGLAMAGLTGAGANRKRG